MLPQSPLRQSLPPQPPGPLVALLLLVLLVSIPYEVVSANDTGVAHAHKPPLVARHVGNSSSDSSDMSPTLRFKVLQLADLHFTGDPLWPCKDAPWELLSEYAHGEPCNEALMDTFVNELLDLEKPDLVVFSGDNVQTFQPSFHQKAVDAFTRGVEARGIPHAEILGNHDDDYGFPREKVLQMGIQKRFSYTQRGPTDRGIDGVGNYQLSVLAPVDGPWGNQGESVFHMYFLDSGGRLDKTKYPDVNSRYDWIHDSQVEYYLELSRANREAESVPQPDPLPAIMFFHIPLREYLHASTQYWRRTGTMNEKVEPSDVHSSLFQALVDTGEVKATFAGHDHTNAYCYLRSGIQLCTGGGAGLGEAYSDPEFTRRARVIEWSINGQGERTITSWKRLFGDGGGGGDANSVNGRVEEEVLFTQSKHVKVGLRKPSNASSSLVVIPHLCAFVALLLMLAAISAALILRSWRAVQRTWLLPCYQSKHRQVEFAFEPELKKLDCDKECKLTAGMLDWWKSYRYAPQSVKLYSHPVKTA